MFCARNMSHPYHFSLSYRTDRIQQLVQSSAIFIKQLALNIYANYSAFVCRHKTDSVCIT
jgi:hypothetical protein